METRDPIARLREELEACGCDPDNCMTCSVPRKVKKALCEIEAKYMKLPVGVDGLPIRLGDVVAEEEFRPEGGTVVGMKTYRSIDHWIVNCGAWVDCRKCRHVKPDTVEGLLVEFDRKMMDVRAHTLDDDLVDAEDEVVADFAERMRKAVER